MVAKIKCPCCTTTSYISCRQEKSGQWKLSNFFAHIKNVHKLDFSLKPSESHRKRAFLELEGRDLVGSDEVPHKTTRISPPEVMQGSSSKVINAHSQEAIHESSMNEMLNDPTVADETSNSGPYSPTAETPPKAIYERSQEAMNESSMEEMLGNPTVANETSNYDSYSSTADGTQDPLAVDLTLVNYEDIIEEEVVSDTEPQLEHNENHMSEQSSEHAENQRKFTTTAEEDNGDCKSECSSENLNC